MIDLPDLVTGEALEADFMRHVKHLKDHVVYDAQGFYRVTKRLKVFKKVQRATKRGNKPAIAALLIPKGALIYASNSCFVGRGITGSHAHRKMRASEVILDSAWTLKGKRLPKDVQLSSTYDSSYKYRYDKPNRPHRFARISSTCSAGLHFFMNFTDAYNYSY